MTSEGWKRISGVFAEAAKLDPAVRRSYLERACSDHPEDLPILRQLLAHFEEPGSSGPPGSGGGAARMTDAAEEEDALVGRRIGAYEIVEALPRSGQCRVYRAVHARLGREVALKALPGGAARDPARRERLEREARAASKLSHQNIAVVHDLEDDGETLYMVSEFVRGRNLRQALQTGGLPPQQAMPILRGVAEALAAAHGSGVVHRDVKPENVMLPDTGGVKLLDFGLARFLRTSSADVTQLQFTQPGTVLGTPGYMAPEQVLAEGTDARTDVFAWGVLAYEVVTGENPFGAEYPESLMRVLKEDPDLTLLRELGSPGLATIVGKCLQKAPEARYASAAQIVAALEGGGQRLVPRTHRPTDPVRWWRVHQVAAALTSIAALFPLAWAAADAKAVLRAFFPALVATVIVVSLRMNFAFLSRLDIRAARAQRQRWRILLLASELACAAAMAAGAWLVSDTRVVLSGTLVTLAVALLVATLVIEPTTARIAFGDEDAGDDGGRPASGTAA